MSDSYDIDQEPIVLSKSVMDLFLKNENEKPSDLIAHYLFYYYTAKWQKTNQVKATNSYVSQGLQVGESKTRNIKKELINLGLLEDIVSRNDKEQVTGHFIKVNFIWGKSKVKRIRKNHPIRNQQGGNKTTLSVLPGVEKINPNALNINKVNPLSTNIIPKNLIDFVLEFNTIQKDNHPNILKKNITKNQCYKQATVLSNLIRLDKYDFDKDIKPAILWATSDNFWSSNLYSLATLRVKSKSNELTKFQNILSKYLDSNKSNKQSNKKGLSADRQKSYDDWDKDED